VANMQKINTQEYQRERHLFGAIRFFLPNKGHEKKSRVKQRLEDKEREYQRDRE